MYGLVIDEEALKKADKRNVYSALFKINLENIENLEISLKNFEQKFDYIILADVLEHLKNINQVILTIWPLLKKDGSMLISIPNINHIDIVLNLIKGNFNYSLFGILDNTHLRFFTQKSFKEWIISLLEENVNIELIGKTFANEIFSLEENSRDQSTLKTLTKLYERYDNKEDIFTVQNIFKVTKI